jgi:hypothetical protein
MTMDYHTCADRVGAADLPRAPHDMIKAEDFEPRQLASPLDQSEVSIETSAARASAGSVDQLGPSWN